MIRSAHCREFFATAQAPFGRPGPAGAGKSPAGGAPLQPQKARDWRGVRKTSVPQYTSALVDCFFARTKCVGDQSRSAASLFMCRRGWWCSLSPAVTKLRWLCSDPRTDAPAQRACRASSTSAPQAAPPLTRRLGFKQQRFFQLWRLEEPTTTYPPALRPVDMLRSNCGARPAAAFIAACKAACGGGVPPPPSRLAW